MHHVLPVVFVQRGLDDSMTATRLLVAFVLAMMPFVRVCAGLLAAFLVVGPIPIGAQSRKPPRRANPAFRVFVEVVAPDVEPPKLRVLESAAVELAERLEKKRHWFELVSDVELAEIEVELSSYSNQQERRVKSIWGVVPPTESGQPDRTQIVEIVTYHSLRARVRAFGLIRNLSATKTTPNRGDATKAVPGLVDQLEALCRAHYWDWRGGADGRDDIARPAKLASDIATDDARR